MRNKQILRFTAGAALFALCLVTAQWSKHIVDSRLDAKAAAKTTSAQTSNTPSMSTSFPARLAKIGSGALAQAALAPSSPTGAPRLFTYTTGKTLHQGGATLFPVKLNMDDVFASALTGRLDLTAPDGSPLSLTFDKHVEHANKNWTWIGQEVGGDTSRNAIITFGPDATFGSLPSINGNQLKLTTVAGQTYIASTPLALLHQGTNPAGDIVLPPVASADTSGTGVAPQVPVTSADASSSATGPMVDVFIAYTSGYRVARGGTTDSAATAINYLVDVANYALFNSRVPGQYRLVGTMEVNYPDASLNSQALADVQSTSPTSPLAAVHAAREKYGADIVSLMRVFNPSQEGCGVAYIMNSSHNPDYAYSEVSDGEYQVSPGYYRYCTTVTLAHEMGHNLGAAHNTQIDPTGGIFPYSHGYRDDAAAFYDIMAYGLDNQTQFEIYSTPLLGNCYNQLCGDTATADVVRTFKQTMSIAAAYRTSVFSSTDDGLRGQITSAATGRCVDLADGVFNNGTRVQMWDCNGLIQQQWGFAITDGTISPLNDASGLAVVNNPMVDGAAVQLWSSTGSPNQSWYFNNAALVTSSGKVLDAVNYGTGNGTRLQVWDDLGGANQRWSFDQSTGRITNQAGRCLDILNYGVADNTPVQIWDCAGTTNQGWRLQNNGLMISNTGLCLQLTGNAAGDGTQVSVATCTGSPQQLWRLRGEIRNKQSNKCLDDPLGGTANGSRLQVWTCLGNSHQQWLY